MALYSCVLSWFAWLIFFFFCPHLLQDVYFIKIRDVIYFRFCEVKFEKINKKGRRVDLISWFGLWNINISTPGYSWFNYISEKRYDNFGVNIRASSLMISSGYFGVYA